MDWKKEYRVSDLFRRGDAPGEGKHEPAASAPGEPPAWAAFADVTPSTPKPPADPAVWAVFADVPTAGPPAEAPPTQAKPEPAVAAEPARAVAPEPVGPELSVSEPAPAAEPSVWKKEIHLFGKRGAERRAPEPVVAEPVAPVAPELVGPELSAPEPVVAEPVAAAPVAPEPVAPGPSVSEPAPAAEPSVWKKEIHLFGKRGAERRAPEPAAAEPVAAAPVAPEPPAPGSSVPEPAPAAEPSVWKKEIHLFGKRGAERRAPEPVVAEPVAAAPVAPEPVAPGPSVSEPVVVEPVAAAPVAPEPVAPGPSVSEPAPAAEPSVWKKEIHLFGKRGAKRPAPDAAAAEPVAAAPVAPEPVGPELSAPEPVVVEPVAAAPVAPEPVAPGPSVSEPAPAAEPSVWKKEIHLFGKRGAKRPAPDAAAAEPVAAAPVAPEPVGPELSVSEPARAAEPSVWKKEIHLFGKRKASAVASPAGAPLSEQTPAPEPAPDPETAEAVGGEIPAEPTGAPHDLEPAAETEAIEASPEEVPAASVEPVPGDAPEPFVWDIDGVAPGEPAPPVAAEPASERVAPDAADPVSDQPSTEPAASAAPEPVEPASGPAPVSVWKQEIRVSDLFRRGDKQPKQRKQSKQPGGAEAPGAGAPETGPTPVPPAAPTSVWKKEIRIGGKRGERGQRPRPEQSGPERRESPDRRSRPVEPRSRRRGGGQGPGGVPDVPLARAINLLPREDEKSRERRLSLPGIAVSVLGVLVIGGLSFLVVYDRAKLTERQGDLEDLEAQAAAIETPADPAAPEQGVELAGEALQRVGALTGALDGRVVWDRLLRELSLTLPEGVWFETLVASVPGATTDPTTGLTQPASAGQTLTITGYAMGQDGVAQLLARLAVIPQVASVQLQSSAVVEVGEEEAVQFSLIATLREPGGTTA